LVISLRGTTTVASLAIAIRLVAADLDGTLLRGDGTVSARTRAALARVAAAGVTIVLVTARPPRAVRKLARDLGLGGLAICCNGALVYDLDAGSIVGGTPLSEATAHELIAALRRAAPGVCFAVEAEEGHGQEPAYAPHSPHPPDDGLRLADAPALCTGGVAKLIALHPTLPLADLLHLAREAAGEVAVVTHSGAPFVEIAAPGVTKAAALATLCTARGIAPAEVVAFGDAPNDLPMLAWAGRGVAVANAHSDVLAAVAEVTAANDEDGVALILEVLNAERGTRKLAGRKA
jgi:HAD superfamily hydrolase (TIGR01484 family)